MAPPGLSQPTPGMCHNQGLCSTEAPWTFGCKMPRGASILCKTKAANQREDEIAAGVETSELWPNQLKVGRRVSSPALFRFLCCVSPQQARQLMHMSHRDGAWRKTGRLAMTGRCW
jgi:hypothetical protein